MRCSLRKYNYDLPYTSNARGQAEKTMFIDAADRPTITRTTTRLYTCRDQVKRLVNPDTSCIDNEYDDYKRLTKTKIDGDNEYNTFDYCPPRRTGRSRPRRITTSTASATATGEPSLPNPL